MSIPLYFKSHSPTTGSNEADSMSTLILISVHFQTIQTNCRNILKLLLSNTVKVQLYCSIAMVIMGDYVLYWKVFLKRGNLKDVI